VHCDQGSVAFEVNLATGRGETSAVNAQGSEDVLPVHPNENLDAREIEAA
jgi:hypothetical protein